MTPFEITGDVNAQWEIQYVTISIWRIAFRGWERQLVSFWKEHRKELSGDGVISLERPPMT